jgi:ribosomal protein S15P/S13E
MQELYFLEQEQELAEHLKQKKRDLTHRHRDACWLVRLVRLAHYQD